MLFMTIQNQNAFNLSQNSYNNRQQTLRQVVCGGQTINRNQRNRMVLNGASASLLAAYLISRYKIITACTQQQKHSPSRTPFQLTDIRLQSSKLLNAGKLLGMLNPLDNPCAVLDVGGVIFDSRVEDVRQAVLAHEDVREDTNALEDGVVAVLVPPHFLEVVDRIHLLLVLLNVQQQVVDGQLSPLKNRFYDAQILLDVLLDEAQDGLAVIFRNVFGFIFVMAFLFSLLLPAFFGLLSDSNFNSWGVLICAILHFYSVKSGFAIIGPKVIDSSGDRSDGGGLVDEEVVDDECPGEGEFVLLDFLAESLEDEEVGSGVQVVGHGLGLPKGSGVLQHCMIYNHKKFIIIKLKQLIGIDIIPTFRSYRCFHVSSIALLLYLFMISIFQLLNMHRNSSKWEKCQQDSSKKNNPVLC